MSERNWASYPTHMPAYIRGLIESTAAAHPPSPRSTLRERFVAWYGDLPAVSRDRPFAMLEFKRALKTQGRHLSPILLGASAGNADAAGRPPEGNTIAIGNLPRRPGEARRASLPTCPRHLGIGAMTLMFEIKAADARHRSAAAGKVG